MSQRRVRDIARDETRRKRLYAVDSCYGGLAIYEMARQSGLESRGGAVRCGGRPGVRHERVRRPALLLQPGLALRDQLGRGAPGCRRIWVPRGARGVRLQEVY